MRVLVLVSLLVACQFRPSVPMEAGTERVLDAEEGAVEERATLWVSYQIRVVSVDGRASDHAADGPGVYYKLVMPAGPHVLGVKLDYRSPTQLVESEVVEVEFTLAPNGEARLLDLEAGARGERRFTPWVLEGAPETVTEG